MSAAERVVRLATYVLPEGEVRDRYRRELAAELHDLAGSDRLRHAIGFASRAWALRRAVVEPVPWHCRLHLYHHDRMAFTDDGGRYRRCAACGRDDPRVGPRVNDSAAWMSVVYPPN